MAPESLGAFRAAVDEIVLRARRTTGFDAAFLEAAMSRPGLDAVLDGAPGGPQAVLERVAAELRTFQPNGHSNASDPAALLKILLLHQVDVAWWSAVEPFADDAAVTSSAKLLPLTALRTAGKLAFRFRAPNGLAGRARNYAVRRWAPEREPRSSGLSYQIGRAHV